jgi:hypothetical protein
MNRLHGRFLLIAAIVLSLIALHNNRVLAADYCYVNSGDGSTTATWQPFFSEAATYRVYAWWPAGISGAATDATYIVNYDGGSELIGADQSMYGSQWYLLGTWPFSDGTSGNVVLSNDAIPPGTVIADAIKFEPVNGTGLKIIIDNGDNGFSLEGDWNCEEDVAGAYPPFASMVEDILAFFDGAVADGDLVGVGPGKSADNRLNALRNMISTAGDLIEAGDYAGACDQLMAALEKCDGEALPPDFAAGDAAEVLADMLVDLMTSLGCQAF